MKFCEKKIKKEKMNYQHLLDKLQNS